MAVNAKNWQELKKPNALEKRQSGGDSRRRAVFVAEPLERGFGLIQGDSVGDQGFDVDQPVLHQGDAGGHRGEAGQDDGLVLPEPRHERPGGDRAADEAESGRREMEPRVARGAAQVVCDHDGVVAGRPGDP